MTGYFVSDTRGHHWVWRRKRNQDYGFWEDLNDGERLGPVGLDDRGYAVLTPDEAREAQDMLDGDG